MVKDVKRVAASTGRRRNQTRRDLVIKPETRRRDDRAFGMWMERLDDMWKGVVRLGIVWSSIGVYQIG